MNQPKRQTKSRPYYAVSLERGLSVLRCFTPDRPVWNLTQISKRKEQFYLSAIGKVVFAYLSDSEIKDSGSN